MRTWFGLILKITERTKSYPIYLPYSHQYNAQLARCLLKGLSLQEPTEIIQLTNHPPLFLTYLTFLKGVSPTFPTGNAWFFMRCHPAYGRHQRPNSVVGVFCSLSQAACHARFRAKKSSPALFSVWMKNRRDWPVFRFAR